MILVSDILEYIGRIYSPLNLANMKIQKIQFCSEYREPDTKMVKKSYLLIKYTYSKQIIVLNMLLSYSYRARLHAIIHG